VGKKRAIERNTAQKTAKKKERSATGEKGKKEMNVSGEKFSPGEPGREEPRPRGGRNKREIEEAFSGTPFRGEITKKGGRCEGEWYREKHLCASGGNPPPGRKKKRSSRERLGKKNTIQKDQPWRGNYPCTRQKKSANEPKSSRLFEKRKKWAGHKRLTD